MQVGIENRRIQLLPPEEVRKIAAGEVIDRPAALVREFLDNAIDSGAKTIEVSVDEGGIRRTEVIDDGCGMTRDDLALSCREHATSKIRRLDDLKTLSTLGFRGEALPAAAAVSRVEIITSTDGRQAWRLIAGPDTEQPLIENARRVQGTSVRAHFLFSTIPARKRFLKREGSEALLCKQVFIEKALAFPKVQFRFVEDGALKLFFPAVSGLKERFAAALLKEEEAAFLHEIAAIGDGFTVSIVVGGPELSRNDRRKQYIIANKRRINDFSLQQAIEYGTQGWFPNNTHPICACFIEIDSALADFNVHPAKREARFTNPAAIHSCISSTLQNFVRASSGHSTAPMGSWGVSPLATAPAGLSLPPTAGAYPRNAPRPAIPSAGGLGFMEHGSTGDLLNGAYLFAPLPGRQFSPAGEEISDFATGVYHEDSGRGEADLRFIGQLWGLFLVVETGTGVFIIDQHAAHERLLFDKFTNNPIPKQELLVPITFTTETAQDDDFLSAHLAEFDSLGLTIIKDGGVWKIEALPVLWRLGDKETVTEILALRTSGENIARRWAATIACIAAIRDGTILDNQAALLLARDALKLPVRRCPHGRPILTEISRADLLKAVMRT
ncbi:DNA mismatch repair protein MutL [Spirochaetia bacterium]|nr:DNA mismatch repair protein MutL [Spirochaetia bacterium]